MTAKWLTQHQQRAWRAYLLGSTLLIERLDRDLRERHGLSLPEYEILVRLSEAPDRSLRMAEIADSVKNSRSRITHTVTRMQQVGLVERRQCSTDGRGVWARLTDAGYDRLVDAAPAHVASVRASLIDVVSPEDLDAIHRAFTAVADELQTGEPDPTLSAQPA
ncbi:MAG: MarR family transcriptional regulator [Nocardioidaceae bacterium]|nr:MarR family transcriptional regulator [Nocardioidaceae bacterium]